jgi:predicted RNA-binding protein
MCEAHAYIVKEGNEEKILEDVDRVEMEGDEIRLVNIFGEQKTLRAKLRLYNSRDRKILLEPC